MRTPAWPQFEVSPPSGKKRIKKKRRGGGGRLTSAERNLGVEALLHLTVADTVSVNDEAFGVATVSLLLLDQVREDHVVHLPVDDRAQTKNETVVSSRIVMEGETEEGSSRRTG